MSTTAQKIVQDIQQEIAAVSEVLDHAAGEWDEKRQLDIALTMLRAGLAIIREEVDELAGELAYYDLVREPAATQ